MSSTAGLMTDQLPVICHTKNRFMKIGKKRPPVLFNAITCSDVSCRHKKEVPYGAIGPYSKV